MSVQIDLIEITINGKAREVEPTNLLEMMRSEGVDPKRPGIAVALNDRVVRRESWESTDISDGDRLEVITALQGG